MSATSKEYIREMERIFRTLSHRDSLSRVFWDFVELSAISLSNAIDLRHREKREQRYLTIVKHYRKEELEEFPKLLALLVMAMEASFCDALGELCTRLEILNMRTGQFFTPYPACQLMARLVLGDNFRKIVEEQGFITVAEPACGSGAMIIAIAEAMLKEGVNYQQSLHVVGTDIDIHCVHMTYLQCSLLHIPADIVYGDTLLMQEFDHWYTAAHILGLWDMHLHHHTRP